MQVNPNLTMPALSSVQSSLPQTASDQSNKAESFGHFLKTAIQDINTQQIQSDKATSMFAEGKKIDLHEVMIAGQKASISMQAALEIRNKAVEAYQEVMRMQV